MKKAVLTILVLLLALGTVLTVRAGRLPSKQLAVEPAVEPVIADGATERFAGALRFRTVSYGDRALLEPAEFEAFRAYLESAFPRAHAALAAEAIGGHSLLYSWSGSDASLAPVLLLGHYDVVPVEAGTDTAWTHPPFGGVIKGGYVWGRGAIDDKVAVLAILESVEMLLGEGYAPRRTVLLSFGHDEEVSGVEGATAVARTLAERGVRPEFVLDEGGAIAQGMLPGIDPAVALVGVAEKGYLSLRLVAEGTGGHSSIPPRETAVTILAHAISRLADRPLPARLAGPTRAMFETLAPEMGFGGRVALGNLWLFRPLLLRALARSPETDAMLRTTTAPTMLAGSPKDNVLPIAASAVVNFRLLPGDSSANVIEHVRRAIDDERVRIEVAGPVSEPPPSSPGEGAAWDAIRRTIGQVYPGLIVAPFLLTGATDARHFTGLTPNIYRFGFARLTRGEALRAHGTDERIPVEDYRRGIAFYRQLILNTTR
jgi:carboxypeptidase PM20D1